MKNATSESSILHATTVSLHPRKWDWVNDRRGAETLANIFEEKLFQMNVFNEFNSAVEYLTAAATQWMNEWNEMSDDDPALDY